MSNETLKMRLGRAIVAVVCGCAAVGAYAGGNGNGSNGSGGSHGAATAGMTHHSEPVSSPWNRDPGDISHTTGMSQTDMPGMAADDNAMAPKSSQQQP